ncbi:unnamed protein product [Moneuplotes crassus]|uniref:Cystinosin-like protein n=1 Tax=Euplotes crassus TaxID=5936 RepID=A0AAD2D2B7_EUPCR|nr:unnamed protein product [Moneuplotes crassus]
MSQFLSILSDIVGWTYFITWSMSFYPIAWTNFRTKKAVGLSIDYAFVNIYSNILNGVYNYTGFIFPDIGTNHVPVQDLVYSTHAIMLCTVYYVQAKIYPNGNQKMSIITFFIIGVTFLLVIILFILELNHIGTSKYWNTAMLCGYLKDVITVCKYTPQVYRNWKRKCTKGWNIWSVIFDFSGGVFSYLQIAIDGKFSCC